MMAENKPKVNRRDLFKLAGGAFGLAALSYYLGLTERPKPPSNDSLLDYADINSGLPIFRPPYLQKDAKMAAFLFPADVSALASLCDGALNNTDSFPYKYVPVTRNVLMLYADMLVSSLDERDSQMGSIPETEISFWVLTLAMQKTSDSYIPHHLAWFIPYLFVDESSSIATGREVYGFNKLAGEFEKPENILFPRFTADVLGFKKFNATAVAQTERLLELDLSTTEASAGSAWENLDSAKAGLVGEISKDIRPDLPGDIVEFVTRSIAGNIPLVFQKQFRHAGDVQKASYRGIVEAPIQIREFYAGGAFEYTPLLRIDHLDSHPIRQKLGLQEEQQSTFAAWLKADFVLGQGVEHSL
jgi:hypothetical protein